MSNPKGISSYWNKCCSSYSGGQFFEYEKPNIMMTFTFSFTTILKLSVICKNASMLSFSMHATQKVFSSQQEFCFKQRGNMYYFNKIFLWNFAHEQCYITPFPKAFSTLFITAQLLHQGHETKLLRMYTHTHFYIDLFIYFLGV